MATKLIFCFNFLVLGECRSRPPVGDYYGRLIGTLQEYAHGIRGTAYAVDESTIFVKGFSYDGTGPGELLYCFHL